jgi:Holliday junction DNA helicase RuvA
MIGSLRGGLLDRGDAEVTIEAAGVGYRVLVSPTTAVSLGDVGQEVFCWVHHHQREDAVTLYGFATKDERSSFEALLGAHGVGPALALAILSVHSPSQLAQALAEGDVDALTLVPGVGRKTAARLLMDLKDRLDVPDLDLPETLGGGDQAPARADVRAALAGLGYGPDEVSSVLRELPAEGAVDDLLRTALRLLAAAR